MRSAFRRIKLDRAAHPKTRQEPHNDVSIFFKLQCPYVSVYDSYQSAFSKAQARKLSDVLYYDFVVPSNQIKLVKVDSLQ